MNNLNFWKIPDLSEQEKQEAKQFREQKIKEILNKKNPTGLELQFLLTIAEMFENWLLVEMIKKRLKNGNYGS